MPKEKKKKEIGKFLSLILRHKPEEIDLKLDEHGWADIDLLIDKSKKHGVELDFTLLKEIVETNDKNRFTLDETKNKVRANQGHSVTVDLELLPEKPPATLFHGTSERYLESIKITGIHKKNRQYVHLSEDLDTVIEVGKRRGGNPVILKILSGLMHFDGFIFYQSSNQVWLTEAIPPKYVQIFDPTE